METQGGIEVRRLHIVYFLSRKGRIDHPHLIRVHHLSRNGVRLRDIKRWLGELRGKDMPDSFSWSYKRKYKTGYVWQDLVDDDLITPVSDNEYVLKGSEISHNIKDFSFSEKKVLPMQTKKEENQSHSIKSETSSTYVSTKTSSSEIEEESPIFGSDSSTLTDDSTNSEKEIKNSDDNIANIQEKEEGKPSYKKKNSKKVKNIANNNSKGASNIFRSLMTCGAVDTNDGAVVMINKQKKPLLMNICSISHHDDHHQTSSSEICKSDKRGGSQRIFGTCNNFTQQQWSGRRSCDGRVPSGGAYKPVNVPNCSQCGKPFKPEKLHSHMKSCKGMKAMSKIIASHNSSRKSTELTSRDEDSF
ncbi:hypothetical protein ACJIZ3_007620 [Penstemon smallii]|uniref:SOSEKI DIX-like domain-containing protein n=1 Tax=Penstemon smallii TaxID=265156 RepID=A0ABD3T7H0_9LAMI